ncbi:MAG: MauE/DoxX family redox-associated membrane protein [Acidimicrobiia bacterium]
MTIAAGPFAVAAVLLAIGGVAKALHPDDTARALGRVVDRAVPPLAVRVGGALEAVLGAAALALGDRTTAVLVAISFAGFAAFAGVALHRDLPIATCGCFGRAETPPTVVHVVITVVAAAAGAVVVVEPGVGIGEVVASQPMAGIPFILLAAIATGATYLSLTTLPKTMALVREARAA